MIFIYSSPANLIKLEILEMLEIFYQENYQEWKFKLNKNLNKKFCYSKIGSPKRIKNS